MSEMGFSWTLYVVDQCINVCQSLILVHCTIMLYPMQWGTQNDFAKLLNYLNKQFI